jgi:stage III sporulation protein AD
MDILIKAAAIAVAGAILGLAVRKNTPEIAIMMTLAVLCVLIYLSADVFRQLVDFIEELGRFAGVHAASVGIVLKTVGISILTKIASVVCQEAGHQAAASGIELVGCLTALYVAIPLFETAMDMIISFC